MPSVNSGSIRLGRIAGIDIYLHWFWFVLALYEIEAGKGRYSSVAWNIAEYLSLFLIVLTHEFGHALACRQVGGVANRILLWPLGGVAYVDPPQRPGAMLWSIAAGPLVNVALLPVFYGLVRFGLAQGWEQTMPDALTFAGALWWINSRLLIFNMLPVYPLDGGKILRSLLWFPLGRAKSLLASVIVGIAGLVVLLGLAVLSRSPWMMLMGAYLLMSCWGGLQQARVLLKREKMPRRAGFACPSCKVAPPLGALWRCSKCSQAFDTFETRGKCPNCEAQYPITMCGECRRQYPMAEWEVPAVANMGLVNGGFPVR
ncbi:MAG: site-2 protease family protein [Terracidiphilus sp.]|jgi:Zn-dependent protease